MKLTHKQKIKMARGMRTHEEIKKGTSLFQTEAWLERSSNRALKAKQQKEDAHTRALARKESRNGTKR